MENICTNLMKPSPTHSAKNIHAPSPSNKVSPVPILKQRTDCTDKSDKTNKLNEKKRLTFNDSKKRLPRNTSVPVKVTPLVTTLDFDRSDSDDEEISVSNSRH